MSNRLGCTCTITHVTVIYIFCCTEPGFCLFTKLIVASSPRDFEESSSPILIYVHQYIHVNVLVISFLSPCSDTCQGTSKVHLKLLSMLIEICTLQYMIEVQPGVTGHINVQSMSCAD